MDISVLKNKLWEIVKKEETSEHDKQIRNDTIDETINNIKIKYSVLKDEMPKEYMSLCHSLDILAMQMKGENNE